MSSITARDSLRNRASTWLSNRAAWPERIVNVALLLIAALLVVLTATLFSFWSAIFVWTLFVIALAVCTSQGWIKLLGPVLFYDMIRTSRRNRYFIMRMLYAGFLFFILSYMVLIAFLMEHEFKARQHAVLAETFFMVFMLVQLTIVVLLTPAYVAGAIAEEKDRKTIEFMLATDLRNREIVLSKLLSRLANMTLLLITGLPILSILQFIGGVDPDLMLSGFVAIGLAMLGIGSMSILFSTLFKKPRDAISLTYLMMVAYGAVATFGMSLRLTGFSWMSLPLWFGDDPATLGDAIQVFNAGNPIAAILELSTAIGGRGGRNLALTLPGVLERFAWFHLTLAAVCITWSIFRLRSIALKQTTAGETAKLHWWQRLRPAVGNFPMLWKELYIESRLKLNWLAWLAVLALLVITIGSGIWVIGAQLHDIMIVGRHQRWHMISESMNIWFRIAGTFVVCVLLLRAGVRASTSITSERERDTLDSLVTTPMSAEAMLFAKLMGNLTSSWPGWLWFGIMFALAILSFGIHPLAIPVILIACFVYGVFMTMIGLAFSMYCKTSLQASVFTVLTTILIGGGHWLITSCFCMPLFGAGLAVLNMQFQMPRQMTELLTEIGLYLIKFQAGVTPPFVIVWCSVPLDSRHGPPQDRHFWEFTGFCILGLFLWTAASAFLWFAVLVPKFRRLTRRIEIGD